MPELHQALAVRVSDWRAAGYPTDRYPAVAEILRFAIEGEEDGAPFPASGHLRYLRAAQFRALETYWYLRVVAATPHVADLYRDCFPATHERLAALGLDAPALTNLALDLGYDGLLERVRADDALVREHRLAAIRETLTLDYPSWILALAMGAGKTILVGAIVATEFALAIEYPDSGGPDDPDGARFLENALVFAPGTTIIESLRELSTIPFERLLPPRLRRPFAAALKITFTRDGERDIPVTRASSFNLIVTNTEKIRIQARPRRRGPVDQLRIAHLTETVDEESRAEANRRLQAIASLPHLGVFSDEAHHTYGRSLGTDLKRVRQTVDYLASATNVVVVVNTTGTPYFERQPLRDVVVWYGLRQGIEDGILKEVAGNVYSYAFDPAQADEFVADVVTDFVGEYGDHRLPDGSPARLAIYFPQNDDLDELQPHVELALARAGLPPTVVLRNTVRSSQSEIDAFNRLKDPASPHRVILLVNKGTEGWDLPSLFATALARRLRTSNNFVLQAASRCLRQVPGNDRPARIYLSEDNRGILDRQLRETYGETLGQIRDQRRASRPDVIRLRKTNLPTIRIRRERTELRRAQAVDAAAAIVLVRPELPPAAATLTRTVLDVGLSAASRRVLRQLGESLAIDTSVDLVSAYAAAVALAANYRLDPWPVLDALRTAYGDDPVPVAHLDALASQFEDQLGGYREVPIAEEAELAIVRPEGFEAVELDGTIVRQAEISYPVDKASLVWPPGRVGENAGDYGFHYVPYNFDSTPEADFYERILRELNLRRDEVEDVYFTGAITDPRKTDLAFTYERDGRQHRYTPDFVVHARGDRWLLVEIKMTARRDDPVEGRDGLKARALRRLEADNPGRLVYRMIFADEVVPANDVAAVREFLGT